MTVHDVRHCARSMRGAASLTVLLLLLMASLLVCAWAQRNVMAELRSAQAQVQAGLAFEAAEAGLAWAQAQLNAGEALSAGCGAAGTGNPGTTRFASRFLGQADARGWFNPVQRPPATGPTQAPVPTPGQASPSTLLAACVMTATGWDCDCPSSGTPHLSLNGTQLAPSFSVQFSALPQPGLVQVEALGCNHWAPPCSTAGPGRADAVSRLRVQLALLPSLATPPAATLTARGDVDLSGEAGLANTDATTGGLVAHLGGQLQGSQLRWHTAPGAPPGQAAQVGDTSLATLSPAQVLGRHLGMSVAEWQQLPGVLTLACTGECSSELLAAVNSQAEVARIAVPGGLSLSGNAVIGSPARPVLLVVAGPLQLNGPVQIHGVVLAERMRWDNLAREGGGLLHGAVVLAEDARGDGAPELVYDRALMRRLSQQHGSWLRVPGSWKDF